MKLNHSLTVFVARLTEPHPRVISLPARYSIRLFSSLMLTLAGMTIILQILPNIGSYFVQPEWLAYQLAVLGLLALFLIAYAVGRRGYYPQMTLIVSLVLIGMSLVSAYPEREQHELENLSYLLVPLILSSMFLPLVYSFLGFFVALFGTTLIALLNPQVHFVETILEPFGVVTVSFVLLMVAVTYFRGVERERFAQEIEAQRLKLALDKEHELNEFKDHLMATISHEFRTPLSAIYTSSELLELYGERMTPERRLEIIHRVQGQVQSLTDMVSEVALMRRMQGGSFPIEAARVNLRDFLHNLMNEFQNFNAPDHVYSLDYRVPNAEVMVDLRLLRPIVSNLLSNAVKYSPPGSPVRLQVERADSRWLVLRVEDCGVGIKLQDHKRIFEPFYRGENGTLATGTGLGLKIVKDCVTLYGGDIDFTSEEGVGTRFAVRLPVECA